MNLFLSRLEADAGLAPNPYELHRALWALFPGQNGACRSFLYRVTWSRPGLALEVLLQSDREPRDEGASRCRLLEGPKRFALDALRLDAGDVLRFSLCANPVKRLAAERCRVPLVRNEERIEWLRRKLRPSAEVSEAEVVEERLLYFRRRGVGGKIATVTFSGVIAVKDVEALKGLLVSGVGAAKGFGCGLLSIAPFR